MKGDFVVFEGQVLLVDDQPIAAEDSIAALKHYVSQERILYTADAMQAMQIIDTKPIDLVFLDIEMPETSGFSVAAYIEEKHKNLPYVFLTGHANFALESYEYEPIDFLTKPVELSRLEKTFERLGKKSTLLNAGRVAVRSGQDYVLVDPKEVRYICKEKRKMWIHLKDNREYQIASTLDELENIFEDYGFFRCHQSFLIPLGNVRQVNASKFGQTYETQLDDGTVIPVSRSKHAKLKEALELLGIPFIKSVISKESKSDKV